MTILDKIFISPSTCLPYIARFEGRYYVTALFSDNDLETYWFDTREAAFAFLPEIRRMDEKRRLDMIWYRRLFSGERNGKKESAA